MRILYTVLFVLGVMLVGARAALALVCPVTLPAHSTSIGATVELPEKITALRCQSGDILAISGDVHPHALAQVCDLARSVVLHPALAETGRPGGALCTFVGVVRPLRMLDDPARSARAPDVPPTVGAPRVQAVQSTQPSTQPAGGPAPQARPLAVPIVPPPFTRTE